MTDSTDMPIEVNPSALPGQVVSLLRTVLVTLGGYLVGRGLLTNEQMLTVVGAAIPIISGIYGLYVQYSKKKREVVLAEAAPNSVAVVK